MTGTDFCVNIHNQSRSYLNHLVVAPMDQEMHKVFYDVQ
jgi:hypothetical protein